MAHKHVVLCWLSIAAALSPPATRVAHVAQHHAGVQPRVTRRSDGQTTSTHRRSSADDAHHALSRRAALALAAFCAAPASASAAESLRDALAARDANRLTKPFYSIPPGPTTFPDWLEGR